MFRIPAHHYFILAILLFANSILAQTDLINENFNGCAIPAGWTTEVTGAGPAVYYVGTPLNPKCDSSTIDGTCMFVIDDDAAGNNTPAWQLTVKSPVFNGSGFIHLQFSADVNFRPYDNASLDIGVWDGTTLHPLRHFQGNSSSTGAQFSEYTTITADLGFYASPTMQIVIKFDDGNTYGWWAGFDNIKVTGAGTGQHILAEQFDSCGLPAGWTQQLVAGSVPWTFTGGTNDDMASIYSMNGSCFVLFDDDVIGADTPFSVVRLYSPVFNGVNFANIQLDYDLIFRRYITEESFSVFITDGVHEQLVKSYLTDVGGPQLNNFKHEVLDLSGFRSENMQLIFQYDDGKNFDWWVAFDNVLVSGWGTLNDVCQNATPITTGQPCIAGDNSNAVFIGVQPSCSVQNVGALWYSYDAGFTGLLKIQANSNYNDVITVFNGTCGSLGSPLCHNRDEHGFIGETMYLPVTQGQHYLIRLSGQDSNFGKPRGTFCLQIDQASSLPPLPFNDACSNAKNISINGNCNNDQNINANTEGPDASRDQLARADIWYKFTTTSTEDLKIEYQSNYSAILTLFNSDCNALAEIQSSEFGQPLKLNSPQSGQTYLVRVSGIFATVEGAGCLIVKTAPVTVPANDICTNAIPLNIGDNCITMNNVNAVFSNQPMSCTVYADADIWFSFVAPASGSIKFNTGAKFVTAVGIYDGSCDSLHEIACMNNPVPCNGYVPITGLVSGQTYYIRIASVQTGFGIQTGEFCLHLIDGANADPFVPLKVDANSFCVDSLSGQLSIMVSGGHPPYNFQGNNSTQVLQNGDPWLVVIKDAMGCEVAKTGNLDCQNAHCTTYLSLNEIDVNCHGDQNGQASVSVENGTGPFTYIWSTGAESSGVQNLSAGNYQITVIDYYSCGATGQVTVHEPAAISATLINIQPEVDHSMNGSIGITFNGGTAPLQINWFLDGNPITNIDLQHLVSGTYTAQIVDAHGCTFSSPSYFVDEITGTQSISSLSKLEVFPNPTDDHFQIQFSSEQNLPIQLTITDATGKEIRTWPEQIWKNKTQTVDCVNWANGVYFVKVKNQHSVFVRKVIVGR